MHSVKSITTSTIEAFVTSVVITFVSMLLFTGSPLLAFYTILTILLIIMTLLGCLTAITGWPFGPVQVVGVIIFIGMSVDYSLHLTHGFNTHRLHGDSTKKATTLAIKELGTSIIGGAVTTSGATIFLLPCWIYLFVQLGVMMFLSTVLSLLFAKLFLAPILFVCGPSGQCSIY